MCSLLIMDGDKNINNKNYSNIVPNNRANESNTQKKLPLESEASKNNGTVFTSTSRRPDTRALNGHASGSQGNGNVCYNIRDTNHSFSSTYRNEELKSSSNKKCNCLHVSTPQNIAIFQGESSNYQGRQSLKSAQSCEENFEAGNVKINNDLTVDDCELNNIESDVVCSKYKSCQDSKSHFGYDGTKKSDFNISGPSTSGVNNAAGVANKPCRPEDLYNTNSKPNRKRPANLRPVKPNGPDLDDTSSDTGNDDYSVGSDDGCIYTYRGGEHLADLPSSFFSLDMGLPVDNHLPPPPLFAARPDPFIEERQGGVSRASSPDMDFLEMDFDPGPSCEVDSNDESTSDIDLEPLPLNNMSDSEDNGFVNPVVIPPPLVDNDTKLPLKLCEPKLSNMCETGYLDSEELPSCSSRDVTKAKDEASDPYYAPQPSTSRESYPVVSEAVNQMQSITEPITSSPECPEPEKQTSGLLITHTDSKGEVKLVRRTCLKCPGRESIMHHNTSGDLVSPGEVINGELPETVSSWNLSNITKGTNESSNADCNRANLSSALYHCTMAKKLMVEKPNTSFLQGQDTSNLEEHEAEVSEVERCMIWTEWEACEQQVIQIGTSACGATAVINAMLGLGLPVDTDRINGYVGTRQRANNAPLPRYLLSRSVAGCTAAALITGLQQASQGAVTARFFSMFPERVVSLSHWLANWISLGAVPIATLNLQAGVADPSQIPDAWHHQMIFGVSPRGVFLANPVECVSEGVLWHQLCSDSVLLVRSRDVVARWNRSTDLTPLMRVPGDVRWESMNVLGQVVNVIREVQSSAPEGAMAMRTQHVRIPAAYRTGITIAALTGSEAHKRLTRACQLPLYKPAPDEK